MAAEVADRRRRGNAMAGLCMCSVAGGGEMETTYAVTPPALVASGVTPPACVTASFPTFVLHAISTDMQPNTSTADQHTAKQGASMATPDHTATPLTNVDSASLKRVREGSLVCLLAL